MENRLKELFGGGEDDQQSSSAFHNVMEEEREARRASRQARKADPERQRRREEFIDRYTTGDPAEGFTTEEALEFIREMRQEMSPAEFRSAMQQTIEHLPPDKRDDFIAFMRKQMDATAASLDPFAGLLAGLFGSSDAGAGGSAGYDAGSILDDLMMGSWNRPTTSVARQVTEADFQALMKSPLAKAVLGGLAAYGMQTSSAHRDYVPASASANVPRHTPQRQTTHAMIGLRDAAAKRPELDAFIAEVLRGLSQLIDSVDAASVSEAKSGIDAIVRLLEQPEVLAELRPQAPLVSARIRGLRLKQQILDSEGGCYSAFALANALGTNEQDVTERRKRGALLGLSLGKRGYAYPVWQVGLAGFENVLTELRHLDPWTQAAFMIAPNRWLDGATPLDALRRGNREAVLLAARLYGEQVAA